MNAQTIFNNSSKLRRACFDLGLLAIVLLELISMVFWVRYLSTTLVGANVKDISFTLIFRVWIDMEEGFLVMGFGLNPLRGEDCLRISR